MAGMMKGRERKEERRDEGRGLSCIHILNFGVGWNIPSRNMNIAQGIIQAAIHSTRAYLSFQPKDGFVISTVLPMYICQMKWTACMI